MKNAVSARTWNRVARWVITGGGLTLILAVLAIMVFIAREGLPLFGRGRATATTPLAARPQALAGGLDDRRELAFEVTPHEIVFCRNPSGETIERMPLTIGTDAPLSSAEYDPGKQLLVVGTTDGRAALATLEFEETWVGEERRSTPRLAWHATAVLDTTGATILRVAGDRDADGNVALAAVFEGGALRYAFLDAEGATLGSQALESSHEAGTPTVALVSLHAGLLAVGAHDGTLYLWDLRDPAAPRLEDHLRASLHGITALRMLLGEQGLVVGTEAGGLSEWLRVRYIQATNSGTETIDLEGKPLRPGEERTLLDRDYGRKFGHVPGLRFSTVGEPWTQVREFESHPEAIVAIAASPRNRVLATMDRKGGVRLHHSTSNRTLLEVATGGSVQPVHLGFTPNAQALVALGAEGRMHIWELHVPHPETSVASLFDRVWYEGYVQPAHVWQSTGGSDEFEPKLGLIPVLLGTLKGTLYALLFSVPIAVLAALYLSQLAPPSLRNIVKPTIELMAAMPSVVVGFLAALWLAPLLEGRLAATAGALVTLPLGLAFALAVWHLLPDGWRRRARRGTELPFMIPFMLLAAWAGAQLGGVVEANAFGGDLKQWLFDRHGVTYDQRNCIVVGVALGFAIIPIIFTISEDAMSSVPPSLTSAALALGASRWQSALHVVLPAASPGIFAAVMLGLGRAIGETMIVLMATGNTPILDLSPFNGMRTMSASIAVEIPEAPYGGTLYRVLFLTGMLLFMFTFLLNTGADLVGRRLRKRYGQF